jgi:signal transduction histidine kinase
MGTYSQSVNAFIEDTCVVIVLSYLLTRGRLLVLLFRKRLSGREAGSLGLLLGVIGMTEVAFPGARFPYVAHTLIVTFAALNAGLAVGLVTAAVVALGAFTFQAPVVAAAALPAVIVSACLGEAVRRVIGPRDRMVGGLMAGMLAEAGTLLLRLLLPGPLQFSASFGRALFSIPANGFGVMLLQFVARDARIRASSERHRLEAERAHALLVEAQFAALRARVHPHFLFNTLTSIAGLCGVAPEKAEGAIVLLGQVMRRALETNPNIPVCLGDEIEDTRDYLAIEQQRFGARLEVTWKLDEACAGAHVPPFAVQTLVENAVNHGIAPKVEPGRVTIIARRYPGHALLAVIDDGVGMATTLDRSAAGPVEKGPHGLQILTEQLVRLYGRPARPRLASQVDAGTRVVFIVPLRLAPTWRDPRGIV